MESNITFSILPKRYIEMFWDDISSELSRADDNTATVEDLKDEILGYYSSIDMWAYMIDNEIKYYLLAQPIGSTYFILRVAGGGKHNPWERVVHDMKEHAKAMGCTALTFCGTDRWVEVLKDLDFSVKQYYYVSPIEEEEEDNDLS